MTKIYTGGCACGAIRYETSSETACFARDPYPRRSASSQPPQQPQNHRRQNHMKQGVFTQPGSFATEPSGLQRIPMSVMPPIATKELQRRDWARWARRRHDAKVSNSGSATAEFEFSAHTLLPMQSITPLDRPTNWMLTNFGRT